MTRAAQASASPSGSVREEQASARPEPAVAPVAVAAPDPRLRSLLGQAYAGFVAKAEPGHVVLSATTSVGLIVRIRDPAPRPPAFVMGSHGEHIALDGACAPEYLRVLLGPLGAYTLLGLPVDELRGQTVDLTDLLGPIGRRLTERLREEPSWPRRFTIVDQLLLGRLDTGPQPAPEIRWAWQRLVATGGTVPIGRLADEVGWSHKHLISRFRRQIGLPPKTAARLVRLHHVLARLQQPHPHGWERLAAESGYADQSHLIREFRTFVGTTPTAFLAQVRAARQPDEEPVPPTTAPRRSASVGSGTAPPVGRVSAARTSVVRSRRSMCPR